MPIIYFEGVDNVGKTTIAKALAERLGVGYFKNQDSNVFYAQDGSIGVKYTEMPMLQMMGQTKEFIVKDRGWLTEFAYSQAFNRATYNSFLIGEFSEQLVLNRSIIIYVTKINNENQDDLVDKDKYEDIHKAYLDILGKYHIPHVYLNVDEFVYYRKTKTNQPEKYYDLKQQLDYIISKIATYLF